MSLAKLIPSPTQRLPERPSAAKAADQQQALVAVQAAAPPYGHRRGWVPRRPEDFGDGGAFPEIHSRQYPLGMGQPQTANSGPTLPMTLGADGRVNFDAVVRQGQRSDKVVHSKFTDLLPKPIDESDPSLQRPDDEAIKDLTEKTRNALQDLIESKAAASNPIRAAERSGPAQFIRYTPSQQGAGFNSGSSQRIVRMVEAQKDPMEPPRFRISKKVPRGPPSPPATVMHSPPRKVTSKEQADWKIPPCVSNWKNPKGYTIPLDKRVAADGRGLQGVHVNEKFVMLAEALHTAEVKSREAVTMRAKVASRMQQVQRERHEEELRRIASRARGERAGLAPPEAAEAAAEARERDAIRRDRAEQRVHERNRKGAGAGDDRDRDISEQIALGRPALQRHQQDPEAAFDSRLFNQEAGLASGFHAGEDEIYNVYDKPWRSEATTAGHLYRPTRGREEAATEEDLNRLAAGTSRFVPDRRFDGASGGGAGSTGRRDGPVQFEKNVEEDPFGLDKFLDIVKQSANPADAPAAAAGSKRSAAAASSHHDGGSGRKRDRRD